MRWLRVILTSLILGLLIAAAASAHDMYRVVRKVRLLTASGQKIKTLHPPELVTGTGGRQGDYVRVRDGAGDAGWAYAPYLEVADAAAGGAAGETSVGGAAGTSGDLAAGPTDASAFPIAECPPEGTASSAVEIKGNPYKNRLQAPPPTVVQSSSLAAFLVPGSDADRWHIESGAEISGYVDTVKSGGSETCNCGSDDPSDYDTHIELSVAPHDPKSQRMIVEITPPWRRLMATVGKDWSTDGLKASILHRQVRVRGWLFFDARHAGAARNTHAGTQSIWRGTAWEIHPVTALEVQPLPVP